MFGPLQLNDRLLARVDLSRGGKKIWDRELNQANALRHAPSTKELDAAGCH